VTLFQSDAFARRLAAQEHFMSSRPILEKLRCTDPFDEPDIPG
jgi:hypothetical protein